jgi:hypothetical protein
MIASRRATLSIMLLFAGCAPSAPSASPLGGAPSATTTELPIPAAPDLSGDSLVDTATTPESTSASAVATSVAPLATTREPQVDHDCDSGEPHELCVPASETTGALVGSGGCRDTPKGGVCRGCRVEFSRVSKGACCYGGLSRFPRCKNNF